MVAQIMDSDQMEYRKMMEDLVTWYQNNNLPLMSLR